MEEVIQKAILRVEKGLEEKESLENQKLASAVRIIIAVVRKQLGQDFHPADYPD